MRGKSDPLHYLFDRFEALKKAGKHDQAQQLAEYLVPFGHGKQAPRDKEDETVRGGTFSLE